MAQFLQRRGRAGRQQAQRPWTVAVLSDYGRDRLAFQSYETILDPSVPPKNLPLGNQSVRGEWPSMTRQVTVHIPSPNESGVNLTEDMILLISPYVAILLAPNGHLLDEPKTFKSA